jgi:hypothetical protein
MFICLLNEKIIKQQFFNREQYTPFPFVEIHNRVRNKTAMTGTCRCADSRMEQMLFEHVCFMNGGEIITSSVLKNLSSAHVL